MPLKDDYRLLRVVDAFASINQRVSLMGIIVDRSLPRRSKGTDYCCSVRIVDASHHSRGLLVNFFAQSMNHLPQVESEGDIILLSHVMIKAYNKEIVALFNKKSSAFALYEGKYGRSFKPYQVYSNFRTQEQDKEFVADLRKWMDSVQIDTGEERAAYQNQKFIIEDMLLVKSKIALFVVSKESTLLREIHEGEQLDLVCKILHSCDVNQDEVILFVWDGTDAPQCIIQEKLDNEKESPLPLQLEGERLSRDILSKFPTVGTVLRVGIVRRKVELDPSSLSVGRWVKLINLAFGVRAGLWYGVFSPCTRIRYVPDEDRLVLKCLSDFKERFQSNWDRMPFTSFPWPPLVTETEKENVALVTLMDILNYSQVTAKFRCIVRVVAMLPSSPEDFCSPKGIYRIRLTLEDPTARIHAFLYGEDAENFFDECSGIDELTTKRNVFLGIDEAEDTPRNPPWIVCGIKSYYLDKSKMWESRTYGVFMTKMIC